MRIKLLASIFCAVILLLAASGCGLKPSGSDGTSPSASSPSAGTSPDSLNDGDTADVSVVTGLVSHVDGRTIMLDLVAPGNEAANAATLTVGTTVYTITGESMTVDLSDSAVIMLASLGYTLGDPDDILIGDLLAVALNDGEAAAVVNNGSAGLDSGPGGDGEPVDTDTPDDTPDGPEVSEPVTYTVATNDLNVRSEPSTDGTVLGKLAKGTTVTGTVTNGWLEFTYKNQTGYCNTQYLTKAESTAGGETTGGEVAAGVPDTGKTGAYTVTTEGLNIRTAPSTTAASLGKLAKGSTVSGTVKNGWLEFKYNNELGYCSAQYLTEAVTSAGSGTGGVPDSATAASYVVVTDGLNVRTGPSTTDTLLGQLPKGTKITGTVKDGWLKFTFNGRTAYVKATYISKAA